MPGANDRPGGVASHVAYSSVRMEPQYMMIGEAAGVAASLAVWNGVAVQDVPIDGLQRELLSEGATLHLH
ncbi:MAG TPA: FAD-dependent oxidoreductase [Acidobacteriaceae bacterium]|nr:FAD-dependent oxidoreductase [Acidobacteriaceae bacterium]